MVSSGKCFLEPPKSIDATALLIYWFPKIPGAIEEQIFWYKFGSLAIFLNTSYSSSV
jgi:hypothetical protein